MLQYMAYANFYVVVHLKNLTLLIMTSYYFNAVLFDYLSEIYIVFGAPLYIF